MLELLYTRQTRHTAGSLPIPSRTPAGPSSRQQHSTNTSTDTPAANLVCSRISSPTPHLHVTQKHPSMGPAASGAAGAAGASARPSSSKPAGCWPQQTSSTVGLPLRFVDTIASKLAFFPPQPPCYTVEEHKDGTGELYIRPVDRNYQRVTSARVRWLRTSQGNTIISAFVPFLDGRGNSAQLTLLYSHGNAVDLGQMLPVYRELGRLLRVNVMGYDYTGYGVSSGQPSIAATCCDISTVLQCLESDHGIKRQTVVLYGQSVGSGPTVWLAAQRPGVGGVVLHSPLLSGVRVFNPNLRYWPAWADIFPNHLLVKKIDVPLLVMHGTADEVIDVSAGMRLAQLAPAAVPPLLAEGFDHQNVEACPEYLPKLKEFLTHVEAASKHGQEAAAAAAGSAASGRPGS